MNKPIFNDEWIIMSGLGDGHTSKVYKIQNIYSGELAALKVIREEYLKRSDAMYHLQSEIDIMHGLRKNDGVVKLKSYGTKGTVVKRNGDRVSNLVYIMMDYVEGGLLFDFCQKMGSVGEDAGRDFMTQMLDIIEYMHEKGAVHRDIKIENILLDNDLNLKLTDFGFSTYKSIESLSTY